MRANAMSGLQFLLVPLLRANASRKLVNGRRKSSRRRMVEPGYGDI